MHIWNDSNNNMVENILYEVAFRLIFIQHTEYQVSEHLYLFLRFIVFFYTLYNFLYS